MGHSRCLSRWVRGLCLACWTGVFVLSGCLITLMEDLVLFPGRGLGCINVLILQCSMLIVHAKPGGVYVSPSADVQLNLPERQLSDFVLAFTEISMTQLNSVLFTIAPSLS